MNTTAARILLFLVSICPIRSFHDFEIRYILATEIAARAPEDARRQEVLARTAWLESNFSTAVMSCKARGDGGKSHGMFQIQPQSPRELQMACGTIAQQVELANEKLDRAAGACPGNTGADALAMYVSGTCAKGIRQARNRWGGPVPAIPEVLLPAEAQEAAEP